MELGGYLRLAVLSSAGSDELKITSIEAAPSAGPSFGCEIQNLSMLVIAGSKALGSSLYRSGFVLSRP